VKHQQKKTDKEAEKERVKREEFGATSEWGRMLRKVLNFRSWAGFEEILGRKSWVQKSWAKVAISTMLLSQLQIIPWTKHS